jgi:hypothetical protein
MSPMAEATIYTLSGREADLLAQLYQRKKPELGERWKPVGARFTENGVRER